MTSDPRVDAFMTGFSDAFTGKVRTLPISQMSDSDMIHEILAYQRSMLLDETSDSLKIHVITIRIKALHKQLHAEAGFDAAQDAGEAGQYL